MSHTAVPNSILTIPLSQIHRITLHFLLPPFIHLIIFAFELSSSIALCWSLNKIGIPLLTGITVFLAFLPALATTVSLLICGSRKTPLVKKLIFSFIVLIFFPIWAMYRLSYRIFWSVEASLIQNRMDNKLAKGGKDGEENGGADRSQWEKEVEEALAHSMEPSSAELYLFLRAFLYSLPNSLLHCCIILAGKYDVVMGYETYIVQTASILFSLIYLCMTAAYYQSFESQRLLGRNFPWRGKKKKLWQKEENAEELKEKIRREDNEAETELIASLTSAAGENRTNQNEQEEKDVMKHHSPPSSPTSIESSPPVTLRRKLELPDVGNTGTYRGFYLPIPNEPAPPPPRVRSTRVPGGFRDIFCDSDSSVTSPRVSRDQSFRSTLLGWTASFKPNRRSVLSATDATLPHAPVPQGVFPALSVPTFRKEPPKRVALERDDALGLCISFCYWFFLVTARMITLGTAMNFFWEPTLGLCAGHALLVMFWLLHREGRPYLRLRKLVLRFALALTTVSGLLLELGTPPFKIKVYFLHATLIFFEDIGLGFGWRMLPDNDSWWSSYTFYTALGSHMLSFSCAVLYVSVLRPKKHILPPEDNLTVAQIVR